MRQRCHLKQPDYSRCKCLTVNTHLRLYLCPPAVHVLPAVPYATCQAPYDTFSFVTKIRVCRDTDGFITGAASLPARLLAFDLLRPLCRTHRGFTVAAPAPA